MKKATKWIIVSTLIAIVYTGVIAMLYKVCPEIPEIIFAILGGCYMGHLIMKFTAWLMDVTEK